jgi:hypothetical protein
LSRSQESPSQESEKRRRKKKEEKRRSKSPHFEKFLTRCQNTGCCIGIWFFNIAKHKILQIGKKYFFRENNFRKPDF